MGDHSTATVDVTHITYKDADVRSHPVEAEVMQQASYALERLPLEEIPALAALPRGSSHMPIGHNPKFVGREEDLKALAEVLKTAEEGVAATVAVTGMGGIGKSQLVSEFVHRYGQHFLGGVFWLNFVDGTTVPSQIAVCGGSGGMRLRADFRHLPTDEQVKEVMSAWQDSIPRLLVFDNCEAEMLLKQWRPPTGGCRVVLTSRRKTWDPSFGVKVIALKELHRKESLELLSKHRPDLPEGDPDLGAVAEELGDLPLAVDLAGRYLARYRSVVKPADYLRQLRSPDLLGHKSLRDAKGISPTDHGMDVGRTFALSYEQLDSADAVDKLALALLTRSGYLAPGEAIPRDLLLATLRLPDEDSEATEMPEEALFRLVDLGLLRTEGSASFTLHRLLAIFVQSLTFDQEVRSAVEAGLLESTKYFLAEGHPEPLMPWVPHLRTVTEVAKKRDDERAASLCDVLGWCLNVIGAYTEARRLYERALAIHERALGEEHPDTARNLNNFANLLVRLGSYEEARRLYQRVLAIREKYLGEDHPDTEKLRQNLAILDA
jgi:tetratricopeptide (TPR) repeat protein